MAPARATLPARRWAEMPTPMPPCTIGSSSRPRSFHSGKAPASFPAIRASEANKTAQPARRLPPNADLDQLRANSEARERDGVVDAVGVANRLVGANAQHARKAHGDARLVALRALD